MQICGANSGVHFQSLNQPKSKNQLSYYYIFEYPNLKNNDEDNKNENNNKLWKYFREILNTMEGR